MVKAPRRAEAIGAVRSVVEAIAADGLARDLALAVDVDPA